MKKENNTSHTHKRSLAKVYGNAEGRETEESKRPLETLLPEGQDQSDRAQDKLQVDCSLNDVLFKNRGKHCRFSVTNFYIPFS